MQKIERQRRSESTWRELVSRQAQSGLTVHAFCELEGINASSLYGWRSRLREGAEDAHSPESVPKRGRSGRLSAPFIDLGALGRKDSRFEVRLDLGGGVVLHLVRG